MLLYMTELWNPSIPTDRDWRITCSLMDDLAGNIQYGNNNKKDPASASRGLPKVVFCLPHALYTHVHTIVTMN